MDISRPDLKAKKRRRQMMYVGAGIATLIVIAFGLSAIEPAAPKVSRSQVWIDAVKRGEMKREVRGPGTLVPKEVRWIAAETAARVDRFVVKPGATVTAN
jgi:HlyD family secretion protein